MLCNLRKPTNCLYHKIRQVHFPERISVFNPLTPKPPGTGHATSILVGRLSAGCCSEREEKAVGRVVMKGTLRGEMKGLPFISPTTCSEEKRGNGADETIPQIN
ncbi:hypothetical protein AVEN_261986-1 [Araneus ventricosus]|uniref:Uncharacterized protein n=1 Tax=Araneus ventricosus TaxID=182803 RepID=A0A4Y2M5A1_ARAVE|nr:hypothetical protein AVEN_227041-1 [Araneus ventricosus]GBN22256.1 hypothetical protein AVEN_233887-1 [Araneus ventricosus]GBN22265.1 hypothetical protein AVEN_256335-1 [Araneus ventricosus]GBN22271.1 hypothetical protein AVEN_261986-1 [Araneus ventricosus]